MSKKLLALTLALAMLLTLLGACGGKPDSSSGSSAASTGESSSEAASQPEEPTVDTSETQSISIFMQADDVPEGTPGDDGAVLNYWKEMFILEIEWQKPPQGSEQEQLSMMFGTGDYTDVIDLGFNTENLSTLCQDGVIYELSEYIDKYMPNYKAVLEANPDVKSALYDDEGHIYSIATVQENPKQWGGLVYRRDILETMTGGNIAFPSGNNEPSTVEDWEYMLGLMKQYFDTSGMPETACLIIPASGYFSTGELMGGFGIGGVDYITDDGKAAYGIAEDNFYNYLNKMKEWYEKGYVYADFASRSQDLFYLPNTALTYGGAAGVWYGLAANLGGAMSLPEYELIMDVQPINSPADTEHGIEKPLGIYLDSGRASNNAGFAVSTACDEEKLIRVLNAFDYFYTEEGSCVRTMGLTSEEGAAECQDYIEKGITKGTREPNSRKWTAEMEKNTEGVTAFASDRMPGVKVDYPAWESDLIDGIYYTDVGHEAWTKYGNANVFPLSVTFTPEETSEINTINTNMQDYANGKIANFIMGRDELTPDTFAAYQQQLKDLGLERYLELRQAGYDRYLARSKYGQNKRK